MTEPGLNRATHLSIVWAVVLAVLTLVEWNGLEREPMSEQIFLPFIEREITLSTTQADTSPQAGAADVGVSGEGAPRILQTYVQIDFNGPLFLVYFFVPVVIFHATGMLWSRWRHGGR
tara:strand:- start:198 stop:551 length:354 start_codon:yes stop_codon:yes gene_type:complete